MTTLTDKQKNEKLKEFVIFSGEGYWSNSAGWGSLQNATIFTSAERNTFNLPIGSNPYWVEIKRGLGNKGRKIK